MEIDFRHIIDEVANQADDFLAGVTDRAQARAGIAEQLSIEFAALTPDQRKHVTDGVMAVLEEEDFFGISFVQDDFAKSDDDAAG